jgi:hypothetical protein
MFRKRRGIIALQYSLEYLDGSKISLGYFFVLDVVVRRGGCASCVPQ